MIGLLLQLTQSTALAELRELASTDSEYYWTVRRGIELLLEDGRRRNGGVGYGVNRRKERGALRGGGGKRRAAITVGKLKQQG